LSAGFYFKEELIIILTADINDKKNTFKVAFLTAASIFVMGYLNGFALNTYDLGTMISAQSGNIVWIGLNAAAGHWEAFWENIGLFLGFAGGAGFALATQSLFKNKSYQFFYNWTVFIIPILAYPLFLQYIVIPWVSYIVLGFACGAALGFFRKMYHLEINNAMATGSARFVGLEAVNAAQKKDKAIKSLIIFLICLAAFSAGSFLYGMLLRLDYSIVDNFRIGLGSPGAYVPRLQHGLFAGLGPVGNILRIIGLIVICVIPYLFCPRVNSKKV